MRDMILAMAVLVLSLAAATALEAAELPHSLWLTVVVGGAGGLAGGIAMHLLQQARG